MTSGAPSSTTATFLAPLPLARLPAAQAAEATSQAALPTMIWRRWVISKSAVQRSRRQSRRRELSSPAGAQAARLLGEIARHLRIGSTRGGAAVAARLERVEEGGERLAGAAQALAHARGQRAGRIVRRRRHAERLQRALHALELAHPGIDAMTIEPRPHRAGERQADEGADQEEREVFPGRRDEADLLQDVELLAARVVEDPLVPAVVERFPGAAQLREQLRVDRVERAGDQARLRREPVAAADAVGRDRAGRIGAHPTPSGLPELCPRVRRALAHDVVAVDGGQVRALVAGDDSRRHAGGAHDDDEGRGEVLAEAFLAVEPELVDAVASVVSRHERVDEALGTDVLQHR